MSKTKQPFSFGRVLSTAVALAIPFAGLPVVGCDSPGDDPVDFRVSTDDMLASVTYSTSTSPDAPLEVEAVLLDELKGLVGEYWVDGAPTTNAMAILGADSIHVAGADGQSMTLDRVANGLRLKGSDGGVGVQWTPNFSQIAFHTPEGTYRMKLSGTFVERRALAMNLAVLGLGGSNEPLAAIQAGALWPVAAILGLVVVSYAAVCLAYTAMCLQSAESCSHGASNVSVTCGGIKTEFTSGQSISFSIEAKALECSYSCNPPPGGGDGDGDDDGGLPPIDPEPTPWDDLDFEDNTCPNGEEVVECSVTETRTESDTSGEIEEITVTSSTTFGYCCEGQIS